MGTLVNKIKALLLAIGALAIAYFVIFPLVCGETQRNYARLLTAWNSPGIALVELRDTSAKVSQESQSEDLQFVAKHLTRTAALWIDLGYARLGDIKSSSKIEYFGRAFLEGYVNPAINLKTIPLWWNTKKFEQTATALDSRNKLMLVLRWVMSGGVAVVAYYYLGRKKLKIT